LPHDTPSTLADRVRAGDATALAAFIEERRPALLAFVERRLGPALRGKLEPQDVLQELAVKALRELPKADLGGRDPFGWLCQIAEQRIIDAHRRFAARKRSADREVSLHNKPPDASRELLDLLAASLTSASQALARNERQKLLNAALAQLPAEARHTIVLIRAGGPFPYDRDGVVFGNFERQLPRRDRGYYREYTVPTPGLAYRGARRIIAGERGELYYTDDHYRTFRRIRE
jgi:RNA polymerase sigma factor (sigma-70 family)